MAFRGWLLFNGLYVDVFGAFLLPMFFPSVAETWPFPNIPEMLAPLPIHTGLTSTSFGIRALCWCFLLHGILRAAAGYTADATLAKLAALSYIVEAAYFASEVFVYNAVGDGGKAACALCPVLAFFCLTLFGQPAAPKKGKKV